MLRNKDQKIDVVIVLNYYWPYVSGLSEVARQVAEKCAGEGLSVEVITTRHMPKLALTETHNGVLIRRYRSQLRFRNGIISFGFLWAYLTKTRNASVTYVHLPMLEGVLSSFISRSTNLIATYHCDYTTDGSIIGRLIRTAVDFSSSQALRYAKKITVTSFDYRDRSRLRHSLGERTVAIPPTYNDRSGGVPVFRQSSGVHFGTLGRIVGEKGLDVAIEAFRLVEESDARLLIAGDYEMVAGGSVIEELRRLAKGDDRIQFLGKLPEDQLSNYFASLDVFLFPSTNSLEAFGIVQLEAMSAGVPVIASNLPGVRVPVSTTGYGAIVEPFDVEGLRSQMSKYRIRENRSTVYELPEEFKAHERYLDVINAYLG